MPLDLQCVYPERVISPRDVRVLPGDAGAPLELEVRGDDYSRAVGVRVNGLVAEFTVADPNRLVLRVPDAERGSQVAEVAVLSSEASTAGDSVLRFRLGESPKGVRGVQKLLQTFVKILFTTPGSDIFAPRLGGGAMRIIGGPVRPSEEGDMLSDFVLAVEETKRQLTRIQSRDPRIPPDERLLAASVLGVGGDRARGRLSIAVSVVSQAGASAAAGLEL